MELALDGFGFNYALDLIDAGETFPVGSQRRVPTETIGKFAGQKREKSAAPTAVSPAGAETYSTRLHHRYSRSWFCLGEVEGRPKSAETTADDGDVDLGRARSLLGLPVDLCRLVPDGECGGVAEGIRHHRLSANPEIVNVAFRVDQKQIFFVDLHCGSGRARGAPCALR